MLSIRLLICAALCFACDLRGSGPGLCVENGALKLDGKDYTAIGVNYFDLFSRTLADPKDTSSLSNLTALAKANIPFARFMCGGYWPNEQRLFITNRQEFFSRLDRVVRAAETNHIGLIPSLFWFLPTAPDLMGEHIDQLGNPNSKTIAYIREYTSAVVSRYKDSTAIWGWEFGNEYNLDCDLPNHSEHRPPVVPNLGTPTSRNERDELTFAHLETAFRAFAESIRKIDPNRMILTGNAVPRSSAWHNARENSWKADSAAEGADILKRDNPDPIDTLSLHLYPERNGAYFGGAKSIGDALSLANATAREAKKPLILGEFGFSRKSIPSDQQRALVKEFLTAIKTNHVALSAFWVFDFGAQNDDFNVTFKNEHAWILKEIVRANEDINGK